MLHEVMLRDINISKALAATCQPLILFRDVRNGMPRWRAVGKRCEATHKPLGRKLIETDLTPEHDAVQVHSSISHNNNAAFELCFSY